MEERKAVIAIGAAQKWTDKGEKMKKITKEELEVFLRKHKLWLEDDPEGERANLSGANLSGADLSGANLSGANLRDADLRGADLRGANLSGANLRGANLRGAYLRGAYLSDADLYGANLSGANLSGADLSGANLSGANLRGADLSGANLSGANLRGADLSDAKDIYFPIACPEEGDFIGFKKAQGYIVKLKITEDAKRCSATGRKCRCSKAEVLSITNKYGSDSGVTEVRSDHDKRFIYRVGETVEEPNFCDDRWQECSPGIHFFITREEAVRY